MSDNEKGRVSATSQIIWTRFSVKLDIETIIDSMPAYLRNDIIALENACKEEPLPLHFDCLVNEVQGSINSALWGNEISKETADILWLRYIGW